jgi:hypothetical protein
MLEGLGESRRASCDVSSCHEERAPDSFFCDRHGDPQKWSHTGLLAGIKCDDCGVRFQSLQRYWFHCGWPYSLEHKHPSGGPLEGDCLKGVEGGLWTHSDGKTRNYPE